MSIDLTQLAMYRFNFWHKGLFPPTGPGGVGMDNAPFIPNPLSSPALMVLASSAASENRDGPRPPPHHFSGAGQSLDKDMPTGHPPPFSSASFVYRPGEPFPSPLYAPLPPFVRPNMDRGLGLLGPSSGAFRHLGPHDGVESYHSAFTPAKKNKSEDVSSSTSSTFSSSAAAAADHHDKDGGSEGASGSRRSMSPSVKEERPSSLSSLGGDTTNSEVHSDTGGDLGDPRAGTPDSEGRGFRKHRKRPVDGHVPCCPICGLTLRPGEAETHLSAELDKLEAIFRGERRGGELGHSGGKTLPSPSGRRGKDSPSLEAASRARFESYLQIRAKRQSRLHARSRNRKRRLDETVCPVCSARLSGTMEELNAHVEMCLKKQRQGEGEEEAVDVEGDAGDHYDDYPPWAGAGPSRLRASTMLHGDLPAGGGFQTCKRNSEDEGDLNVDGDDSEELYGRPQFTESDLIPAASSDQESRERLALRGAVLGEQKISGHCETAAMGEQPSTSSADSDLPLDLCQSESGGGAAGSTVAAALAARVKELSDSSRNHKHNCLICTKAYVKPLVSVQCWHVLCERCWFHTLSNKKLCPQCNAITTPHNLRRIFL